MAAMGVRVGGVVEEEERVWEGEGDEAGGLHVLQALQLRADRHCRERSRATKKPKQEEQSRASKFLDEGFVSPPIGGVSRRF